MRIEVFLTFQVNYATIPAPTLRIISFDKASDFALTSYDGQAGQAATSTAASLTFPEEIS
jgi:hypothetical protein